MFLQEYNIMHITQVVYISYTALYRTTVKTTEAETVIVVSHFWFEVPFHQRARWPRLW